MKPIDPLYEMARIAVARMDRGECIHCGAKIDGIEHVGRCVYAKPCGHRQGQAERKKKAPRGR